MSNPGLLVANLSTHGTMAPSWRSCSAALLPDYLEDRADGAGKGEGLVTQKSQKGMFNGASVGTSTVCRYLRAIQINYLGDHAGAGVVSFGKSSALND